MSKLSGVESSRVESIPIMMDCDNFIGILLKSLAMSCDLHICRDDMTPYRIVSHGLGVVVLLGMMLCRVESKVFKITSAFWLVGFSILNRSIMLLLPWTDKFLFGLSTTVQDSTTIYFLLLVVVV
jgi:hypothetical protein